MSLLRARVHVKTDATGEVRVQLRVVPKVLEIHVARDRVAALVCSDESQDLTTRVARSGRGYGLATVAKTFTRHARKTLRECGAILEEWYGKNAVFLTGTLPGSTPEALQALADYSGYVMSRVRQWIRDALPESGVLAVWEWQRRGALHIHLVVGSHDKLSLEGIGNAWHAKWCGILEDVSLMADADLFADNHGSTRRFSIGEVITDAQWVAKSVANYLSKYVSKVSSKASQLAYRYPLSWWSISKNLGDEAKERRRELVSDVVPYNQAHEEYERLAGEVASYSKRTFHYDNPYQGQERFLVSLNDPCEGYGIFGVVSDMVREIRPRWKKTQAPRGERRCCAGTGGMGTNKRGAPVAPDAKFAECGCVVRTNIGLTLAGCTGGGSPMKSPATGATIIAMFAGRDLSLESFAQPIKVLL